MKDAVTRKGSTPVKAYCLPNEKEAIERTARQCGLSVGAYLRNVALGYEPRSTLDLEKIDDLAKVNADLGRLGGLLKLWLTNKEKKVAFGSGVKEQDIQAVLLEIQKNQLHMREIMKEVIRRS